MSERQDADTVAASAYWECVEACQQKNAEIDAVEEVLIDQAGCDGMTLADCATVLLSERNRLRDFVRYVFDHSNDPQIVRVAERHIAQIDGLGAQEGQE